jgi:hypothetical protein
MRFCIIKMSCDLSSFLERASHRGQSKDRECRSVLEGLEGRIRAPNRGLSITLIEARSILEYQEYIITINIITIILVIYCYHVVSYVG